MRGLAARLHQCSHRLRRGVEDVDPFCGQHAVAALGAEVGMVEDHGRSVNERRDDAVRGAQDRAGLERREVHVARVQIEGVVTGCLLQYDRIVRVDARVRGRVGIGVPMQERGSARARLLRGVRGGSGAHQARIGEGPGNDLRARVVVDQEHALELRHQSPQCFQSALVQPPAGHQYTCP